MSRTISSTHVGESPHATAGTGRVQKEITPVHNVLGTIRADARLLYATTAGTLLKLNRSNALNDYAQVAERLRTLIA